MNAAFDRLDITSPKLKFSHIDKKIPSDRDPCINDFMCGPQTQERWEEFVKYLAAAQACTAVPDCRGVDYTAEVIKDILLSGIYNLDVRREVLGTARIEDKTVTT